MIRRVALALLCPLAVSWLSEAAIDTEFLERPWPNQWVHELEVGRHPVRWRQRASRRDGIFAGVRFDVPLERQTVWGLANDYQDIGQLTPGVTAVRYLEQSETRQVIAVDVKVLWKELTLTFEVERDPPRAVRFRLVNEVLGEYRGLCVFDESPGPEAGGRSDATRVELATWLLPSRPVPMRLLLLVERMVLLTGVREFLESCEARAAPLAR